MKRSIYSIRAIRKAVAKEVEQRATLRADRGTPAMTPKQRKIAYERAIKESIDSWDSVLTQPTPKSISIGVQWKRSRTWGNNPHAQAVARYPDGTCKQFTARCSGCGYDKLSTVVANILNQCLRGHLARRVCGNRNKSWPYGIAGRNNALCPPSFPGGVGISCYTSRPDVPANKDSTVIRALGGIMHRTSWETFDDIVIELK
jgi:hypothetical protein